MKNFDVKSNKFKDISVLIKDTKINNVKSFNTIDEIYFYLEELFKSGKIILLNYQDFWKNKYHWL